MTSPKVLLSWSSGKDSAWALHVLRQQPDLEVVGLLTTFNEEFDRVAMHAVRWELVEAEAAAAGLPLIPVILPYPCSNEISEERMKEAIAEARATGITHVAFGELFLVGWSRVGLRHCGLRVVVIFDLLDARTLLRLVAWRSSSPLDLVCRRNGKGLLRPCLRCTISEVPRVRIMPT